MGNLFLVFFFRQFLVPGSSAFETWHDLPVKPLSEAWNEFFPKIIEDTQKYVAEFSFNCHI